MLSCTLQYLGRVVHHSRCLTPGISLNVTELDFADHSNICVILSGFTGDTGNGSRETTQRGEAVEL